ncbi:putative ankyrin repeat-containing protein [Thelonectria olida]|uniref:Ankyrin repeat-containing protein n=1 Tax=Thelonectria olida TaxID=1576542 RepID=A0A9P9ATB9_9HYPO|nr:putative ankyrin repeat-containing protein [Thelonectria olida]
MLRLPNELLPAIATQLEFERDINALARTNRRLFSCLDHFLYCRNIQRSGSSALKWAAIHGRERTTKKALDFGASCIGEALVLSVENEHEGVTRILLSIYTSDGDMGTKHGQRALIQATSRGYKSIVGLLLDSGKVEVNSRDDDGRTPLSYAASLGYDSIARLLLNAEKVEADTRDTYRRTPLSYAASMGYEPIVRLLLDTGKVEADSKDIYSRTPLSYAASIGSVAIVRLLLDTRKGVWVYCQAAARLAKGRNQVKAIIGCADKFWPKQLQVCMKYGRPLTCFAWQA